jgi:signal peptidase I
MPTKPAALPEKRRETTVESLSSIAGVLAIGLFIITSCRAGICDPFPLDGKYFARRGSRVRESPSVLAPFSLAGFMAPMQDIRRGDVVVFLHPAQPGIYVVKRIIGIPGDHIHLLHGIVYRSGQKLDEPYVVHQPDGGG